jgi:hypothetical protein
MSNGSVMITIDSTLVRRSAWGWYISELAEVWSHASLPAPPEPQP